MSTQKVLDTSDHDQIRHHDLEKVVSILNAEYRRMTEEGKSRKQSGIYFKEVKRVQANLWQVEVSVTAFGTYKRHKKRVQGETSYSKAQRQTMMDFLDLRSSWTSLSRDHRTMLKWVIDSLDPTRLVPHRR